MRDKTDQSQWINTIMKKTFLNEEALWDDLKKVGISQNSNIPSPNISPPKGRIEMIERKIYGLILYQDQKANKNSDTSVLMEVLQKKGFQEKAKEILKDRLELIQKVYTNVKDLLLFETESYYNNKNNLDQDIDELLISLEEEYLKKDLSLAMESLQKAEQRRESSEVLRLLEECQNLSQRINTIKTIRNAYEKYRDWETDRKSTRLNSSHEIPSRMPSSA